MNDSRERYSNPCEIRHRIGARGQLTISNVSGDVELRATDGDEVTVVAQTHSLRSDSLPITVRKGDGSLTIDVQKRGGSFAPFGTWFGLNDGIEFQVSVPRAALITINTVSADIRSHSLAGEQTYNTVSGDVVLNPAGGKIRVQTVSGDTQVTTTDRVELNASSTSGDVRVNGVLVDCFEARTVSGDIQFTAGFGVGQSHTIETVSGDLAIKSSTGATVEVKRSMDMRHGGSRVLVVGDGAAQVQFRTLSGDCVISGATTADGDRDRHGKHGRHDRFERQLERRIERELKGRVGEPTVDGIDFSDTPNSSQRAAVATEQPVDHLEVLRALERGEIDVDEASRRLQEAS